MKNKALASKFITIREFEKEYGKDLNIKYAAIYRLIKKGAFTLLVHYKEVHKARRSSYLLNPVELLKFFSRGK